jgi:hypothetical protein
VSEAVGARARCLAAALFALLAAAGCFGARPAAHADSNFVGHDGTLFTLGGKPFRPVGVNLYGAASDPAIYSCGLAPKNADSDLDGWFARIRAETGANVVRVWAFQRFTAGGTNFAALDRVLRLAAKNGLKVIPVLEDQYGNCSQGGERTADWYASGYQQPYGGYPLSYRDYVARVVGRYKNDPTIFAWMLMNEAASARNGVGDPDALLYFTTDMSNVVKTLDPNHLLTLGVSGGVHLGVWGALQQLHALPAIDFIDYHDYAENDTALPGAPAAPAALVQTAVYTQDATYHFVATATQVNAAASWQEFSSVIPAGDTPFHYVGLAIQVNSGYPPPDLYVDGIAIGGRVLDFEDGSSDGVTATDGAALDVSGSDAFSGSYALHIVPAGPGAFQLQVPADPADLPGTPITFRVLVDAPGAVGNDGLLAGVLQVGAQLQKPVLVGEAGMEVCTASDGAQLETPRTRAQKLDAKMQAFFAAGGAGYLIWDWWPDADCGYDFSSGDPLNAVLQRWATQLNGS